MKLKAIVFWSLLLLPPLLSADDFELSDGREFKNVTVTRIEQDGIVVMTDDGIEKLPFKLLSKEVQLVYPYKPPVAEATPAPAVTSDMAPEPKLVVATPAPKTDIVAKPASTDSQSSKEISPAKYCELGIKAGLAFLVLLVTLLIAGGIVRRLIAGAALQQKQKEFDASNAQQFHTAYSDFVAIWKLWNHYLEQHGESELPDHGEYEIPHASRWELLTRAYVAEGALDAVFLKLTTSRKLSPDAIELLGRFRQAFQALSQAIKSNKPLSWKDAENPDYLVFKRLASSVALLINDEAPGTQAVDMRADAFRQITSARWERSWSSESSHPPTGAK